MMKRWIAALCLMVFALSAVFCVPASAEESLSNIVVTDGKTETIYSVVKDSSDLYVSADFLEENTMYEVTEYNQGIRLVRGARYINASYEGDVTICNQKTDASLGAVKTVEDKNFYSLSHLLPLLNCYAVVSDGKLMFANDAVSVWDLFQSFNVDEIVFDLRTEYIKSEEAASSLINDSSLQRVEYLQDNLSLAWGHVAPADLIGKLGDQETFESVFATMVDDSDAMYDTALEMNGSNCVSTFDGLSFATSQAITDNIGVSGKNAEFVKAYDQTRADRLAMIENIICSSSGIENAASAAASELPNEQKDLASGLIANSKNAQLYQSYVNSKSSVNAKDTTWKAEFERLALYTVLSEIGKDRYLKCVEDATAANGAQARLYAMQYIYFTKCLNTAMQKYYTATKQNDIAKGYEATIARCNDWLAKFTAAGTAQDNDAGVDGITPEEMQTVLSQVSVTDRSADEKNAAVGLKEKVQAHLDIFRESCANLQTDELIYVGATATKGQIGAMIHCIMSHPDDFELQSSKWEVVRTKPDQFKKVYDAVDHTYRETDIERYPSEEIVRLLQEKFDIEVILNKNYDVYGSMYYEEGYFYNYLDAYRTDNPDSLYDFKVNKSNKIKDSIYEIQFSCVTFDEEKERNVTYKGYAVMDVEDGVVYEYNETVAKLSAARKKQYQ